MSTTVVKEESECAITDDVDIKEEEFEADVVEVPVQAFEAEVVPVQPFQAEDMEVESEGADMKEELCLDSEGCGELAGPAGSHELKLDAKQPLCIVSKTTTLADLGAKQVLATKFMLKRKIPIAVTEKMFSVKHHKASGRIPRSTNTGRDQHTAVKTDFVLLTPGAKARQRRKDHYCKGCSTATARKCQLCHECESDRAYRQLSHLYSRPPAFKDIELYLLNHAKDTETKTRPPGETSHNLYPAIRDCYVRLERSEAAEEALRLNSTININITIHYSNRNANSHTKKPYRCKMCKTTVGSPNELCQACVRKNLKPFRDVLVTKINLQTVTLSKLGSVSYVGEKPYSCEVCNTNVDGNHSLCPACERDRARKQLFTMLK